jgi:hypothetical protein
MAYRCTVDDGHVGGGESHAGEAGGKGDDGESVEVHGCGLEIPGDGKLVWTVRVLKRLSDDVARFDADVAIVSWLKAELHCLLYPKYAPS